MNYNHCHYSTLQEHVGTLKNMPERCWYRCVPCKKTHMIRDGERIVLILSSSQLYKWFTNMDGCVKVLHVDNLQIAGTRIPELLMALKTEYSEACRPNDILVIAGEIDVYDEMVPEIKANMKELKRWANRQNKDNTCAFVTIPMIPFDTKGIPIITKMRQAITDLNERIRLMNGDATPPQFHSWGVHGTGYKEGTQLAFKNSDWVEALLGENMRGSGSLALRTSKVIPQGRACLKYFRILYKLDQKTGRKPYPVHTAEERRCLRN